MSYFHGSVLKKSLTPSPLAVSATFNLLPATSSVSPFEFDAGGRRLANCRFARQGVVLDGLKNGCDIECCPIALRAAKPFSYNHPEIRDSDLALSCPGFFGHSQPGGGCLVPPPVIPLSDLQST